MLHEYAVEPRAIATDWQSCRYLSEKFGFDRGRLLSLYPSKWLKLAIEAASDLPDIQKKKVVEKLRRLKQDCSVRAGRDYDPGLADWLTNAVAQHTINPFRAIIAVENAGGQEFVLRLGNVDERHPLMNVVRSHAIPRDVESLATGLQSALRFGRRIVFVDPFFAPYERRYKDIFSRLLSIAKELNPQANCEVHYRYHKDNRNNLELGRKAARFKDMVPDGVSLTIYCWREREDGEDFHARYLLMEQGGISIDAGFDPVGAHQTTDVSLMGLELSRIRLAMFAREATTYELVGPVLEISADGSVKHI